MYEPLLTIQRDASIPFDDRIRAIKKILLSLPPIHLNILKYLINFLQKVEDQAEFNKMTVS